MPDWLPSERAWIAELSERLLVGENLLIRAIPRWGLTAVCETLHSELGESAVLAPGRAISETNQRAERERLDVEVNATLERCGYAQLIFDDYGRALRRSQGGTLHSMLYRLVVDSPSARDTGVLLVARSNDSLDLNFSGSPLLGRTEVLTLPTLKQADADEIGCELAELRQLCGDSTWIARRLLRSDLRQARVGAIEHLNADRRRIAEALPPAAIEVIRGGTSGGELEALSREVLMCLGAFDSDGSFRRASVVGESKVVDEVRRLSPGWPRSPDESVGRFAELLGGVKDAYWVDRYIFADAPRVRSFLEQLRGLTPARLKLLACEDRDRPDNGPNIVAALTGLRDVEVRFMHRADRKALHDRHLVLPALRSGYVLPTARVILGLDEPGTAHAVPMPSVDYAGYWGRAAQVFPTV